MGFRFQKRVRILPGVTLNFSKSGVSTSFGVRGARITKGRGKTRVTVGLPGSGLSYTEQVQNKPSARSRVKSSLENGQPKNTGQRWGAIFIAAFGTFFFVMLMQVIFH